MRLKITQLIPAILVVTAIVSSSLMYGYTLGNALEHIEADSRTRLKLDISRLQNILYNLLTEGDLTEARLNISVMSMDEGFRHLLMIDDRGRILISNSYAQQGKSAKVIQGYDTRLAEKVRRQKVPVLDYLPGSDSELHGYYPLIIRLESEKGLPRKRIGILYARYSLATQIRHARRAAIEDALVYGVLVLFTTLLIWIVLHVVITRRLNLLTRASRAMASGNLDVHVNPGKHDEITELGESFNDMVARVKQDIHKREHAEEELRDLNATLEDRVNERTGQLRQAQRIARLGNWRWDMATDELSWSDELFAIVGRDIVRSKLDMAYYLDMVHPGEREELEAYLAQSAKHGTPFSMEHRILHSDKSKCWVRIECVADRDGNGKPFMLHGVIQDVTARKAELEEKAVLEAQLQRAQKMEALGQLTGGIAHDFNNILAGILGFADLAKRSLPEIPGNKLHTYLDLIVQSSERATSLISQMLTFSRADGDIEQREDIRVNSLFEEINTMLRPTLPSSIDFEVVPGDDSLYVHANSVMMNQVLMNLCLNARDALENAEGHIRIELSCVEGGVWTCSSCHQAVHGDYVMISVTDSGHGIDKSTLAKVFDPFFSTKEVGKGTGMGLAIVHGIIHKHCGHIVVDSEPGKGTCIRLLLPRVSSVEADEKDGKTAEMPRHALAERKTVLVVDDEPTITMFLGDLLESQGYCPVTRNNSRDALDYFVEHHDQVSLLITDQTMPGMTGDKLVEAARAIEPDLPVILCTGYSQKINREQALAMGINEFLDKPLNPAILLEMIGELLSTGSKEGAA